MEEIQYISGFDNKRNELVWNTIYTVLGIDEAGFYQLQPGLQTEILNEVAIMDKGGKGDYKGSNGCNMSELEAMAKKLAAKFKAKVVDDIKQRERLEIINGERDENPPAGTTGSTTPPVNAPGTAPDGTTNTPDTGKSTQTMIIIVCAIVAIAVAYFMIFGTKK